jgi:hypothetical protein
MINEPEEGQMREIAISEFKAKCLSLLDQVQKTKKPIRVTPIRETSGRGRSGITKGERRGLDWLHEGHV